TSHSSSHPALHSFPTRRSSDLPGDLPFSLITCGSPFEVKGEHAGCGVSVPPRLYVNMPPYLDGGVGFFLNFFGRGELRGESAIIQRICLVDGARFRRQPGRLRQSGGGEGGRVPGGAGGERLLSGDDQG